MRSGTSPARALDVLDRSATWLALAGVGALLGGRRSRRGALRAVLSLGLARAVTALPFVGRRTSAPIHGSAAAAAVAAAVAMEAPIVAVPLMGGFAGLVASNVRSGRRTSSDVALGAAIGVGAAIASVGVWPRSPSDPADAERRRVHRQEQPAPAGAGLVVVFNASSGSGKSEAIELIERELPDAEIVRMDDADEIDTVMKEAAGRARAIGVVGGDGTISAAAAAALDADVPIMIVPGGTLNHFARDVGIEDADEAIDAVRSGEVIEVDVGMIDGRMFLNTASFGTYSEFVEAREQFENRIGKWPAVFVALWRTVLWCDPLDVTINGERCRIWTIFIGNCAYDPPGFAPATRTRLDDDRFDVRIIDGTRPAARLRLVLAVLTGQVGRSSVYTRRLIDRLDVTAGSSSVLAADGEIFEGSGAFTVEKNARRLRVFVPHR